MISSSTGDMPWLNQPNPGEFMLASQNSGANVARNFMQAFQNAQERKREDSLLPLRRQLLDNQIKAQAIGIETSLWKQQDLLTNKKAFSEMSKAAAEISASGAWAKPESEKRIWEIAAQYPSVVDTPEFMQVVKQFDTAGAAATRAKEAETQATKTQNELDIANQRIALGKETNAYKERMNSQDNETRKEIAQLKVINAGHDYFTDRALARQYSEGVRKIFKQPDKSLDDMIQESEMLKKQLSDGVEPSGISNLSPEDAGQMRAIEKEIGELQKAATEYKLDMAKSPKKSLTDFGKDNRLLEIEKIQEKIDNLKSSKAKLAPVKPDGGGMVQMTGPDGKRYNVPAANVETARAKGFK